MVDKEKPGTLPAEVRRVADELLVRVITGRYPAGLRFPSEPAIAQELGCGRSTVREALRHLAGLGVVQSRRGSGATVLDFRREGTPSLLTQYLKLGKFDQPPAVIARELLELRTLMATEAVRLASRYAQPKDLADARAQLDKAKSLVHEPLAHAKSELLFFRALVHASQVWPAVWLANSFWGPMHDLLDLLGPFVAHVRADYQPRMERLFALIVAHDETRAMKHVTVWLRDVDETLMKSVEGAFRTDEGPPAAKAVPAKPPMTKKPAASTARKPAQGAPHKPVVSAAHKTAARPTPRSKSRATPRSKSHAMPRSKSRATPRPKSHATPRPKSHATPRPKSHATSPATSTRSTRTPRTEPHR